MATLSGLKKAKFTGSFFFLLLGLINAAGELWSGQFGCFDVILLLVAALPLLINKRVFYLTYGVFMGFVMLFLGVAFFIFHINAVRAGIADPYWYYVLGYAFIAIAFFCALLLIYFGMHYYEKGKEIQLEIQS